MPYPSALGQFALGGSVNAFNKAAGILILGLACAGCRSAAPAPAASPGTATAAAPARSFEGMGPEEVKQAFKDVLFPATAPHVTAIDAVDETHYRYRAGGFMGRTDTISVYLMKISRVDVTKGTWVFVFDGNGRRIEKVKFATVEEANTYKALLEYVAGPEYHALALEAKKARIAAQTAPPAPAPTQTQPTAPAANGAPCSICGEPRGDVNPCPHCGME